MRRLLLAVALLVACPLTAWATEPSPAPADSCPNDLLTTGEYVALIRPQRDAYEIEIARLRAHVKLLEAEVARKASAAVPPTPSP